MEFRLVYKGRLKANGSATEKQAIRRSLDPQLRRLWEQQPLDDYKGCLPGGKSEHESPFIFKTGPITCIPVVASKAHLVAEIAITILRPEAPGSIVTQCGDIDNRLKTLLDALRMPQNVGELGKGTSEREEGDLYCLLEDDNLITHLSVTTDRRAGPEK